MNFGYSIRKGWRWICKHTPEILTITSLVLIPVGDYFLITGTKNNDKKRQVLGIIFHVGSGVCICCNYKINAEQKLILGGLAAAKGTELIKYRQAVKESVDEEKLQEIEKKYSEEELEKILDEAEEADKIGATEDDKEVVYVFPQLHKAIQTTPDQFLVGILNLNEQFSMEYWASINFLFDRIDPNIIKNDPELKQEGDNFGWEVYEEDPDSGVTSITIQQYTVKTRSGRNATMVLFNDPPLRMDEWQDYYETMFRMAEEEEDKRYAG